MTNDDRGTDGTAYPGAKKTIQILVLTGDERAVGAVAKLFLDKRHAGTFRVGEKNLPKVTYPARTKTVRVVASLGGFEADATARPGEALLTVRLPKAPRRRMRTFPEYGITDEIEKSSPSDGAIGFLLEPPYAECPDGRRGSPCVTCQIDGESVTICV